MSTSILPDLTELPLLLNLNKKDTVFISSDLFRLALAYRNQKKNFSSNQLLDVFINYLSEGTLVIPAYTDHLKSGELFDVNHSKPNTGALSLTAFKDARFKRSSDPFHSFFACGALQNDFVELKNSSTFGSDSGFALLHQKNAVAVFIDIPLNECFTFVHYCEEQNNITYRKLKKHQLKIIDKNGEKSTKEHHFFTRKKGFINFLNPLETELEKSGILKSIELASIKVKHARLDEVYEFISRDINENRALNIHRFSFYEYFRLTAKQILKK